MIIMIITIRTIMMIMRIIDLSIATFFSKLSVENAEAMENCP